MKLSVILSVFERHFIVSLGSEMQHGIRQEEEYVPDRVELQSAVERARVGFQPNGEGEDDDEG